MRFHCVVGVQEAEKECVYKVHLAGFYQLSSANVCTPWLQVSERLPFIF
jgi:hypothetical protein